VATTSKDHDNDLTGEGLPQNPRREKVPGMLHHNNTEEKKKGGRNSYPISEEKNPSTFAGVDRIAPTRAGKKRVIVHEQESKIAHKRKPEGRRGRGPIRRENAIFANFRRNKGIFVPRKEEGGKKKGLARPTNGGKKRSIPSSTKKR